MGTGDEAVRGTRRQAEEVARSQWVFLAVEQGHAAAGEDVIEFLRDLVIADARALPGGDAHAPGGGGGLLERVDERLDVVGAELLRACGVAAAAVDHGSIVRGHTRTIARCAAL